MSAFWVLLHSVSVAVASPEPSRQLLVQQIVRDLDLTAFRNSTGPRREPRKRSFADYGFTQVDLRDAGASLYQSDRGWMMSFEVLSAAATTVDICFHDQGLKRPQDSWAPTYNAWSALRLKRTSSGFSVSEVRAGLPGCASSSEAS